MKPEPHNSPCPQLLVNCDQLKNIKKRIDNHSERLDKIENTQIRLDTLMDGIHEKLGEIKTTLESGFKNIAEQYVTKESLEIILKDGKYGKLIWGVVGSVLGALAIAIAMGIFTQIATS